MCPERGDGGNREPGAEFNASNLRHSSKGKEDDGPREPRARREKVQRCEKKEQENERKSEDGYRGL
jgi:hypothetical protein